MICPRCKGLVVEHSIYHMSTMLPGVRCVNCGWIKIDEQKVRNNAARARNRSLDKLGSLQLSR